jgi:succinate dehydrogenase / fumarate reductase membrane anchor subunit
MTQQHGSIRTPLARARGLGSAKDGTHHWWMQRVTSIALVPLSLYLATQLREGMTADYAAFIAWVSYPPVAIALILFIVTSFYHAALGMQVIIEDYAGSEGWKIALLTLNNLLFFFLGVACLFAITYISFALYGRTP